MNGNCWFFVNQNWARQVLWTSFLICLLLKAYTSSNMINIILIMILSWILFENWEVKSLWPKHSDLDSGPSSVDFHVSILGLGPKDPRYKPARDNQYYTTTLIDAPRVKRQTFRSFSKCASHLSMLFTFYGLSLHFKLLLWAYWKKTGIPTLPQF
jgi:hypothetical protein